MTKIATSRGRVVTHDPSGFVVVTPSIAVKVVPLCCPVCAMAMRTHDDSAAHMEHGCCHACALEWVHPNRAVWAQGWRPDAATIMRAVAVRPRIAVRLEID